MPIYTKQEIALVLQAVDTLNQKGSSQKIKVSTFCREFASWRTEKCL